jgi:hypothetical protein
MFNVIYSIIDMFVLVFFILFFCCRSMAPSTTTSFTLRSILEKDKLNGINYTDWIRNLRIILRAKKKEDVLDTPLPQEPADDATAAVKNAYKKACDNNLEVSCLMLACMEPELQMQFETNHDRSASGHVPDIGQD